MKVKIGFFLSFFVFMAGCSNPEGMYNRAIENLNDGKYDLAIKDLNALLRINPADAASRFALGLAYQSKGMSNQAVHEYELTAQSALTSLSKAYFNLGILHYSKKELDLAERAYLSAVQLGFNDGPALYNLGFVYKDKGLNDKALASFNDAIRVDPKNVSAYYNAGLLAEGMGKLAVAREKYALGLKQDPKFAPILERLAKIGK